MAKRASAGGYPRIVRWGQGLGRLDRIIRPGLRWRTAHEIKTLGKYLNRDELSTQSKFITEQAYRLNSRAIFEVTALYCASASLDNITPRIWLKQIEHLMEAHARGQGVIILGMHMGNGLAMARHLNEQHGPIHVVYRESNKITPGFYRRGIERLGLSAINASLPDGGFRDMLRALKRQESLLILMDQGQKRGGVMVTFLGKRMGMPQGPAELARRSGAAIVPIFLSGANEGGWTFECQAPLLPENYEDSTGLVHALTQRMEQHILKTPQLWSWHQRRWVKYPFVPQITGMH